jgi:hypothetical protein
MKTIYYTQCLLKRKDFYQVSWIPEKFAIEGNALKLKESGEWVNGWVVLKVWQTIDEKHLPDSHNERKAHKIATGDILA